MPFSYESTAFEQYRKECEAHIIRHDMSSFYFKQHQLGYSYMHHPIYAYQVGFGKTKLLLTGGVHGRECINSFALLCMLKHYSSHFSCYSDWFSSHSLFVIPMVNPDGYFLSLSDPLWKNNGRNVDINRNFPCKLWQPKWNGDQPMSEPETKLLIQAFHDIQPDFYFDIHSRGKGIYYYRSSMSNSYNDTQKQIAETLSSFLGYTLYTPDEETNPNDSGGNTVQYFAETFHKPAFTIETVQESVSFPISLSYITEIFSELLNMILLF